MSYPSLSVAGKLNDVTSSGLIQNIAAGTYLNQIFILISHIRYMQVTGLSLTPVMPDEVSIEKGAGRMRAHVMNTLSTDVSTTDIWSIEFQVPGPSQNLSAMFRTASPHAIDDSPGWCSGLVVNGHAEPPDSDVIPKPKWYASSLKDSFPRKRIHRKKVAGNNKSGRRGKLICDQCRRRNSKVSHFLTCDYINFYSSL